MIAVLVNLDRYGGGGGGEDGITLRWKDCGAYSALCRTLAPSVNYQQQGASKWNSRRDSNADSQTPGF